MNILDIHSIYINVLKYDIYIIYYNVYNIYIHF